MCTFLNCFLRIVLGLPPIRQSQPQAPPPPPSRGVPALSPRAPPPPPPPPPPPKHSVGGGAGITFTRPVKHKNIPLKICNLCCTIFFFAFSKVPTSNSFSPFLSTLTAPVPPPPPPPFEQPPNLNSRPSEAAASDMDLPSFNLDSARGASQLRPIFYPSPEEFRREHRPNGIDRPVKMGGGG